jgi:L-iditol 2-dehydrogenase
LIDGGMLLSLSESLSAARNFGCDKTKDVLVYGAGPMGLAIMTYMKIIGVKSLTAIDSIDERLEKAITIAKVDRTINFARVNVDEALAGQLFDIVVDAVGATQIIMEGSHRLKQFGRVGSMGVLKDTDCMINASALKNNTLLHMLNFPYGEYDMMAENIAYIQQGLVNPKNYYSHVLPMDQIEEVMELVRSKKALKVILTID